MESAHKAPPISDAQLTHLARLANVPVPDATDAKDNLRRDLGVMVAFVQRVQSVADAHSDAVLPRVSVTRAAPREPTQQKESVLAKDSLPLSRETLLANASTTREGFYVAAGNNVVDDGSE